MTFIRKNQYFLILATIGVIFFLLYSILPFAQLDWHFNHPSINFDFKFNTPDESLNYYFSSQFARTNQLQYFEPLNNFMHRVIFPRWALVIDGRVTPGNFVGIDLIYGTLAKIFSVWSIPFLTPLFAVVGVLFFYLFIKEFFKEKVAFISALLMFVFPGWWYYASRTLFHNILFLSLLIIGLYFLIRLINSSRKKLLYSILFGLFLGLSLIVRTSEIVWVTLVILIICIFNLKKIFNFSACRRKINSPVPTKSGHLPLKRGGQPKTWSYLLISLIVFSACFVPIFYHHQIL